MLAGKAGAAIGIRCAPSQLFTAAAAAAVRTLSAAAAIVVGLAGSTGRRTAAGAKRLSVANMAAALLVEGASATPLLAR